MYFPFVQKRYDAAGVYVVHDELRIYLDLKKTSVKFESTLVEVDLNG